MAAAKEISVDADKELKKLLFLRPLSLAVLFFFINPAAVCFRDADKEPGSDAKFWWLFELMSTV